MRLKDKVAVITGAGSGMGKEMAKLFAAEGARVVAADIAPGGIEQVVSEIQATGGRRRRWSPTSPRWMRSRR